jgi:hypothetical protein
MPEYIIPPPFKSFEDFQKAYTAINTASKILGGIKVATNPTPLGIAGLLANEVSERFTDKSIPEHILKYLRKNIKPATGSGNVGPDKSGTVIAEGGYFRDPTQRHATAMRAGQYNEGGAVSDKGIKTLFKAILSDGLEEGVASYLGISQKDTDWASSIGERYGLSPSKRDAARHVALGWLASKTDTPELAKFFADAREFRPIAGGPIVSRRMDLENNDIGYNLPAKDKNQAEIMILDLVEKGQVNTDDPSGYAEGGKVEQEPAFLEALERQRLRDEAFDNEFAIEVAAQSNYAADIDPSIARYYGLPDAAPGYDGLRGFELTSTEEYPEGTFLDKRLKRIFYETNPGALGVSTITPEMGTVSAIDRHANPVTYAHEYRHKNFPELSERQNRIADFLTALDERQLFDMLNTSYKSEFDTTLGERKGSEALDFFRYDLRFERDNPEYGIGAKIFGEEWDRGARSTRQGFHEYKDQYIRARIKESPAIKLLNQYEELQEYNEELPEQNQERVEERQERESEAAVKNYAMGGGVGSLVPVARNMFNVSDIKRGVGAYTPYIRR